MMYHPVVWSEAFAVGHDGLDADPLTRQNLGGRFIPHFLALDKTPAPARPKRC